MNRILNVVGAGVFLLSASTAQACEILHGWTEMDRARDVPTRILLDLDHDAVTVGQPFDVRLVICSPDTEAVDRVDVDAIMPLHRHGMNYRPAVRLTAPGAYTVEGLFFHMPGTWQIVVRAYRGGGSQKFTLDVEAQ
ncbi:hypothetical protein [Thalassobaculum sp.]|uniref:FixH family protein n=1 Tax=Thalassobaculum sp. TaxID=2022740 RepID=UPI0032ED1A32